MRIEEIKNAVVSLPADKYRQFRDWFLERDWEQWDKQINSVSKRSGVSGLPGLEPAIGLWRYQMDRTIFGFGSGRTTNMND